MGLHTIGWWASGCLLVYCSQRGSRLEKLDAVRWPPRSPSAGPPAKRLVCRLVRIDVTTWLPVPQPPDPFMALKSEGEGEIKENKIIINDLQLQKTNLSKTLKFKQEPQILSTCNNDRVIAIQKSSTFVLVHKLLQSLYTYKRPRIQSHLHDFIVDFPLNIGVRDQVDNSPGHRSRCRIRAR